MNLLIFPEAGCDLDDVYVVSHDDLPVYLALTPQVESADSIHICWPDNEIRILEKGDEFSRVLHIATGRSVWMPNAYLLEDTRCRDYTDSLLPGVPPAIGCRWNGRLPKGPSSKKTGGPAGIAENWKNPGNTGSIRVPVLCRSLDSW